MGRRAGAGRRLIHTRVMGRAHLAPASQKKSLREAVRAAAERSGPTASQQGMLWRTVGFLSVTLQRQNFQVLAGCAPSLAEQVEGRLGRPLSEAPEFWRAAPEEALLWGSDEFGYPPSPRGGPPDLGAAEGALSWAAAGHMRAAGLRL